MFDGLITLIGVVCIVRVLYGIQQKLGELTAKLDNVIGAKDDHENRIRYLEKEIR